MWLWLLAHVNDAMSDGDLSTVLALCNYKRTLMIVSLPPAFGFLIEQNRVDKQSCKYGT